MDWDRRRFDLGRYLDGRDPDIQLANKLEVCLECRVDFYAPYGKLGLRVVGVDKTFSLGKLEARRREILAYLKQHDLLRRNAEIPLPELPLRIGLITAAGSAAESDFLTGLEASPWAFVVRRQGARMQGEQLQQQVLTALAKQVADGVDVVVITRGGGSRADLSWFDQKDLAVGIAECPVPVITAIGHEIDRSIADDVAHTSCKTPTAAAELLVELVDRQAGRVTAARDRLPVAVSALLEQAADRMDLSDRLFRTTEAATRRAGARLHQTAARLQVRVSGHVGGSRERLARLRAGLGVRSGVLLQSTGRDLASAAARLAREPRRRLQEQQERLRHLATQVRLLDPERLLARGYTMTLGPDTRILTSAADLAPGDRITTRFRDGDVASIVQPGPGGAAGGRPKQKGKSRGGKKENPGQETLFR